MAAARKQSSHPLLLLLTVAATLLLLVSSARADSGMCTSKPPKASSSSSSFSAAGGAGGCGSSAAAMEVELPLPKLHDISVAVEPGLALWKSADGVPEDVKWLAADMNKGDQFFATMIKLNVHTGTHVDAPAHYVKEEWEAGNTVDKLDLEVLVGPALVVEVPSDTNITAEVLQSLDLPGSLTRLLFKTQNTKRDLMRQTAFASDFVGMTADGAQWLVDNTQVKLVGIDYISIASLEHLVAAHEVLLSHHVIPVEGLELSELVAGHWYHLTCLPLNIKGAEGAPARCVAYGPQDLELTGEDGLEGDEEHDHGSSGDEAWPSDLGSEDEL